MLTFFILALVMTLGALGVITLRQPVHAALSLVGTLLTLAVTYVTLQAHFLAAIQVIVYAGAIMVLFLFVIMLLNVQGESARETFRWLRPAAYATALLAALAIGFSAFQNPDQLPDFATVRATLGGGTAAEVGEALFGEFVLAFQLVGVLLLTGIVGAVSLVQRRALVVQPARTRELAAAGSRSSHDDLTLIKGVGPKLAGLLRRNGVTTFRQLASLSEQEVDELDAKLQEYRGRIRREGWPQQAERLAGERGG